MNSTALKASVIAVVAAVVVALFASANEPPSQVESCESGQENGPSCEPRNVAGLDMFHPTLALV